MRYATLAGLLIGIMANVHGAAGGDACYRGSIGDNGVTMTLREQPDASLDGQFRDDKLGLPISLEGAYDGDGQVIMKASSVADAAACGRFVGELDAETARYSGVWNSADNARKASFNLKRIARLIEIACSVSGRYSVTVQYAAFDGKSPFIRALNARLEREGQRTFKEATKTIQDTRAKYEKARVEDGVPPGMPFTEDVSVEVMYCDGNFVSILYTQNIDTGWFHGNDTYIAKTFRWDGDRLRELAADDMIERAGWATVTKLCVDDLRRQGAPWLDDVRFDAKHPPVMNLAPSGIVITFAPYEVGSYAEGTWTVLLPYSAVRPCLRAKIPVAKLAK